MRRVAIFLLVCVGCGSEPAPAPVQAAPAAIGGDLIDPGAGADDVIVATVDGRPVWGSCVAGHARARGITVDAAVEACIAIELLAAEAVHRGLVAAPATQAELRTALVDGFVGQEFEDTYTTPATLPADVIEANLARNARELDRPELRDAVYARATFFDPETARPPPVGSPEDVRAHALAVEIHAALGGREDLFTEDLVTTARRVAGTRPLKVGETPYRTTRAGPADPAFAEATFTIPAIGAVSAPTRTPWGWDVILLVDVIPARTRTRDELVAEMFPGLRRGFFDQVWTAKMMRDHAIERYPDALAAAAPADPGAPAP